MGRKNWRSEKIFDRLVNNKSQKTYWDNISELRKRATEDIYKQAFKLAKSESDKRKIIGIDVLAQLGFDPRIGQKKTIELFFELLENTQSNKVLFTLFFGISHNNDNLTKKQVAKLIKYKDSKNTDVRYSLVSALSGIENTMATETLIELSEDKFSSIRNWATFGIGTLSEENNVRIINALWNRTKDKHQETKLEAIIGLAVRKEVAVKEQIISELINGKYTTLLFDAIIELNDKEFIPYLESALNSAIEDNRTNKQWLTELKECLNKISA